MRIYNRDEVCPFRFTRAAWGEFSNFAPLAAPIAAGPWTFATSEHLYQACQVRRRAGGAAPARRRADGARGGPPSGAGERATASRSRAGTSSA